ncbi:5055_t:CDS:2 [Cetraspora pellucida]|uniref:5055_t:CDS:1 n=1 Tax=Cetraspora pellucida TaxID=1433469 RepID=A0A9N8WHT0_9GLOM|nr:5055_t:CDS:2 [Cetraspora pellucida]
MPTFLNLSGDNLGPKEGSSSSITPTSLNVSAPTILEQEKENQLLTILKKKFKVLL